MKVIKDLMLIALGAIALVAVLVLLAGISDKYGTKPEVTSDITLENDTVDYFEAYFNLDDVIETRYYTDSTGYIVEYCMLYDFAFDAKEISMDRETFEALEYSMKNRNSDAYEFSLMVFGDETILILVDKD